MDSNKSVQLLDLSTIENLKSLGNEGDTPFINTIVELYFQESERLINEITENSKQNSFHQLQMNAHTLKGSSANIGAVAFSAICKEIEFCCRDNVTDNISELIAKAEECFLQTKAALLEQIK